MKDLMFDYPEDTAETDEWHPSVYDPEFIERDDLTPADRRAIYSIQYAAEIGIDYP